MRNAVAMRAHAIKSALGHGCHAGPVQAAMSAAHGVNLDGRCGRGMRGVIECGVDGIMTNYPEAVAEP